MTAMQLDIDKRPRNLEVPLLPEPTNSRVQMPFLAESLQKMVVEVGREAVQEMWRNGKALRKAYDAGDAATVWRICASGQGIAAATENGYQFGVPTAQRAAMLRQHRAKRYGAN